MNDFETYWRELTIRNPSLTDSTRINLSIEEFRKQLERAFRKGQTVANAAGLFDRLFGDKQ